MQCLLQAPAGGTNNDRSNGVVLQRSDFLLCGVVCVCIVTLLHPVSHQSYGESQDCNVCILCILATSGGVHAL